MRVLPLVQEDLLEWEMAPHSDILAWRIPWAVEPCETQAMELQRVRQDGAQTLFQRNSL